MTRFKLYPHMGCQKCRFSNHFQKGWKVSHHVLGCFGGVYLIYFYKWSDFWWKMYKFNVIFSSFGTKKHNVKWGTAHGKKTYRPWKCHWLYRDYFFLFTMRSKIMGKIVPLIFMDFTRAGDFFAMCSRLFSESSVLYSY